MQVIIGLLGSIVTILYLLDRLGIDLGGFNPFYWRRRRAWLAKHDGDISSEEKELILEQFQTKFSLDSSAASELLGSAAHLLGAPQIIDTQLNGVAKKNKDRFSADQAESMLQMIVDVTSTDGELSAKQSEYIDSIRSLYARAEKPQGTWS